MPPKVRITKEDIVNVAIGLVRDNGVNSLNARAVAAALGCSTQPVFSNFSTMKELQLEVRRVLYRHYLDFLMQETKNEELPKYKAFGMAYIRFAKEEKEFFKLLFMCDRTGEDLSPTEDFEESAKLIMNANGVSIETARFMHLEIWAFVHGIAVMIATSFLTLDTSVISRMLTDAYKGICLRYTEDKNNDCNKA